MNPTEEIKQKLDLAEVIGEYVQLKPGGGQSLKGLCPFHREKTPSFYVSRDKQLWTCFGCNKGGDLFTFVGDMEGMDFPETLRYLGEKAGVEITRFEKVDTNIRTRLFALLDLAARSYHTSLMESESSEVAREYLKKRDIPEELAQKFMLGYAPDRWDALTGYLKKHGFREQEMIDAGLAVRRQDGSGIYDRFRHRLMFPVYDARGKVVGFSGRLLDERRDEGKYINTPQTLVYNKSQTLYGLNLAKQAIKESGSVIVVEGNMDVIASHKAGLAQVVASSGTALTTEQLALVRRFTDTILICFDADPAGESAAKRGIDLALLDGFTVRVVTLPAGLKDPDECVRQDPELWRAAVAGATDVMTYYFKKVFASGPVKSAEDKKQAGKILLPEIGRLQDPIERDHWLRELAARLGVTETVLIEALSKIKSTPSYSPSKEGEKSTDRFSPLHKGGEEGVTTKQSPSRQELLAETFLVFFTRYPSFSIIWSGEVRPEWLPASYRALYSLLISAYHDEESITHSEERVDGFNFSQLRQKITQEQRDLLPLFDRILLTGEMQYGVVDKVLAEAEVGRIITTLREEYVRDVRAALIGELRLAEDRGDRGQVDELMKKISELV